uniref:Uncharacterized protein n=1 Tax=Solanum tuberosum TaxID=4113 RepID=M1DFV5_SOLTU
MEHAKSNIRGTHEHGYSIMTSNIAESVNAMFDVEREFPIIALFDEIKWRFALLFHQSCMELVNSANKFVPSIEKDISNSRVLNQVANEPSVFQKVDYFHHSDPNALGMLNQAADGGDIGASYVLAIISIF